MRYKTVPEPRDLEGLYAIRDAVPLVPAVEEDCCARIAARTGVVGRDAANEWLAFLEALGLVAEAESGHHRTREDPDVGALADRFLENVFGAHEILAPLDPGDRIDPEAAFEALRRSVPRWERHHNTDWEREWRETARRLLEWADEFGALQRIDADRYRVPPGGDTSPG